MGARLLPRVSVINAEYLYKYTLPRLYESLISFCAIIEYHILSSLHSTSRTSTLSIIRRTSSILIRLLGAHSLSIPYAKTSLRHIRSIQRAMAPSGEDSTAAFELTGVGAWDEGTHTGTQPAPDTLDDEDLADDGGNGTKQNR